MVTGHLVSRRVNSSFGTARSKRTSTGRRPMPEYGLIGFATPSRSARATCCMCTPSRKKSMNSAVQRSLVQEEGLLAARPQRLRLHAVGVCRAHPQVARVVLENIHLAVLRPHVVGVAVGHAGRPPRRPRAVLHVNLDARVVLAVRERAALLGSAHERARRPVDPALLVVLRGDHELAVDAAGVLLGVVLQLVVAHEALLEGPPLRVGPAGRASVELVAPLQRPEWRLEERLVGLQRVRPWWRPRLRHRIAPSALPGKGRPAARPRTVARHARSAGVQPYARSRFRRRSTCPRSSCGNS
eukprot:2535763-Prymnesium_polylepis.2